MEKIKKYGYYLFIYALFAIWAMLLAYFVFIVLALLFSVINAINISNAIKFVPYILMIILAELITTFLYYMPLKYFCRIKKFETAKIKDVILAVVFVIIDYFSFALMVFLFLYVLYWIDVNLTSLTNLILG